MTHDNAAHSYRVEAVRSGDWWSITVPELSGVFSQAKRLDQVERSAASFLASLGEPQSGIARCSDRRRPILQSLTSATGLPVVIEERLVLGCRD